MLIRTLLSATAAVLLSAPLHAGLVGFYSFDGNANDLSGNGNHGAVFGASQTAGGYEGQAYDFDGNDDRITLPVNINPSARPQLTIGAWVLADTATGLRGILSHDDGGYDRGLMLDYRGACGSYCFSSFTGSGVLAGPPATTGNWVFLAARYDQAGAGTVTLNVGGNKYTTTGTFGSGFSSLSVGMNPGFGHYFDGRIDNVFIYDEFLSDARLDEIRLGGASAIVGETATPEPSTYAMLGTSLLGLAEVVRRRAGNGTRSQQ